ncbi:hypothetical protein QUF90_26385 [Desulfococcaceae bacterium HSG9]|nr:hypothetical protein [Desulfococcaceae bacterium HSG9]
MPKKQLTFFNGVLDFSLAVNKRLHGLTAKLKSGTPALKRKQLNEGCPILTHIWAE